MITVRKINNKELIVNCELITMIEGESDTVISLTTGEKLVVADRPIRDRQQGYRIPENH